MVRQKNYYYALSLVSFLVFCRVQRTRLADGGADLPQNVIALCPTCHRKAHYSLGHLEFNNKLINKVAAIEAKLIE